jgi:hypothetical protein
MDASSTTFKLIKYYMTILDNKKKCQKKSKIKIYHLLAKCKKFDILKTLIRKVSTSNVIKTSSRSLPELKKLALNLRANLN